MDDPTTPMKDAAVMLHELFVSYVAAGFTEHQACIIIGSYLANLGSSGSS